MRGPSGMGYNYLILFTIYSHQLVCPGAKTSVLSIIGVKKKYVAGKTPLGVAICQAGTGA